MNINTDLIKNKCSKLIYSIINLVNNQIAIYVIGALILFPFLVLSYYNQPSSDDFDYNNLSRNLGYFNAQKHIYINWSGRYIATALMTIKELVSLPFTFYKIIPIAVITSLIIAISYAIRSCLPSLKKTENHKITIYIFIIYLVILPSVSQAFYWLPASMSYQTSNIFLLVFIGLYVNLLKTNSIKYLIGCGFVSLLIIGTNETSMLLLNYFMLASCVYQYVQQKKIPKHGVILLICSVLFSLIVILAPGNSLRSANVAVKHELIDSISRTILTAFNYIIVWLPLIILLIGLIYNTIRPHISKKMSNVFKTNPYFIFLVIFFIPFVGFFPAYWALSHVAPPRTINSISFYFILGCLYLVIALIFQHKLKPVQIGKEFQVGIFIVFLCIIASSNNIRTAYSNIISGDASAYNTELNQRYLYLLKTSKEELIVPMLNHKPATIYFDDITPNKNDWRNKSYQKFFNKTSIILNKNFEYDAKN